MLQELASETGAGVWAIVSMFFFFVAWLGIAAWVYRTRPEEFEARARLPLEGDTGQWQGVPSETSTER